MIEIDARGLSCPIPVVKTKKAIEDHPGEQITMLVEGIPAKENVSRFASSKGLKVQIEKIGTDEYRLVMKP